MGATDYPNADHQLQFELLVRTEQVHPGPQVEGYNDNRSPRYSGQSQAVNLNSRNQYDSMQFVPDGLINNSQEPQSSRNDDVVGLALGPPQSAVLKMLVLQCNHRILTLSMIGRTTEIRELRTYFQKKDSPQKS
ncbi:hypothetical protein HRI_002581000 [Hibiscus trionum]|uniref:Uncharacterized protein n=1 Tax=Hibiscus trionum TaxID=183268 RepID=A0A9W7M462_HIBTR|nr:hypothetical protein HRI_002581000 [Hibiscus trionum]